MEVSRWVATHAASMAEPGTGRRGVVARLAKWPAPPEPRDVVAIDLESVCQGGRP